MFLLASSEHVQHALALEDGVIYDKAFCLYAAAAVDDSAAEGRSRFQLPFVLLAVQHLSSLLHQGASHY